MTRDAKGARPAIIDAFNRLVLAGRDARPRIADVLSEAGVARSTFYEHFDGRDSLLLDALRGPLGVVAGTAAGDGDEDRLVDILEHFRAYRREAAALLTGALSPRILRALADLIAERIDGGQIDGERKGGERSKIALHLAEIELGFIRLWLTGETPYAARALARLMIQSAAAQRVALRADIADNTER